MGWEFGEMRIYENLTHTLALRESFHYSLLKRSSGSSLVSQDIEMNSASAEVRTLQVELPISVRAYDVDALGIVSNIAYVRWFEDLRTAFLEVYMPMREMFAEGFSPILVHTDIRYHRPVTFNDRPVGRAWVEDLGRARWRMGLEICVGENICCSGKQEGLFVDIVRKRAVPVPERLVQAFESYRGSSR
jgi:acyl-CoA thioester hydrolase